MNLKSYLNAKLGGRLVKNNIFKNQSRNALMVIALMFVSSSVLRFGGEAGKALADEIEVFKTTEEAAVPASCEPSSGIASLLEDLSVREDRVQRNEMALQNRMLALEIAEEKYSSSLEALLAAENTLNATISKASTASEIDLAQLTSMYENMKPKDAAKLFEEMDPVFSAGFLGRMNPSSAASVLAGLKPETAYAISVILAGRNTRTPEDNL